MTSIRYHANANAWSSPTWHTHHQPVQTVQMDGLFIHLRISAVGRILKLPNIIVVLDRPSPGTVLAAIASQWSAGWRGSSGYRGGVAVFLGGHHVPHHLIVLTHPLSIW